MTIERNNDNHRFTIQVVQNVFNLFYVHNEYSYTIPQNPSGVNKKITSRVLPSKNCSVVVTEGHIFWFILAHTIHTVCVVDGQPFNVCEFD